MKLRPFKLEGPELGNRPVGKLDLFIFLLVLLFRVSLHLFSLANIFLLSKWCQGVHDIIYCDTLLGLPLEALTTAQWIASLSINLACGHP